MFRQIKKSTCQGEHTFGYVPKDIKMNMFYIYLNLQKCDIRNWYIWIPSKGVYSIVNILKLLCKIWDPILDDESVEDLVYPPQNQALEKIKKYSFEEGPIYERTHSAIIFPHPKNMN